MNGNGNAPLIDLRKVVKRYTNGAGEVTVLKEVSLQVQRGEFISIQGPSGSGKSTLLNMITGVDRPSQGEIYVDGEALHTLGQDRLAHWRGRKVGVIFQFFQLLPSLTILENVMLPMDFCGVYPRQERPRRALALLGQVGIPAQAHKLPSALSGGEQQRAAVARALANDPPLLAADEPTGNLDSAASEQVFALFQECVAQGKTLLMVTHDRQLSQHTGRVLHMLDGRLLEQRLHGIHPAEAAVGAAA